MAFDVLAPTTASMPIVGHVPHASLRIPADVRAEITLDDTALEGELVRLTDSHTDMLFDGLRALGATLFVNRLSRLVFDPERFLDDELEPAAAVGQGVVYTHGTQRQRMRSLPEAARAERIERLYRPYHAALTALVEQTLTTFGSCLLIDCHSFSTEPLPSERDQARERPDICIGTDDFHSPARLVAALEAGFDATGLSVRLDTPFRGTFVPERYLARDRRVNSIMIEVRRGLYMNERTGERSDDFGMTTRAIERAVGEILPGFLT